MTNDGTVHHFGKGRKLMLVVCERLTEKRQGPTTSLSIIAYAQTMPGGQTYEVGRIDLLPERTGEPIFLHSHQRKFGVPGGPAQPIDIVDSIETAVQRKLLECRDWVTNGEFLVDDDFSDQESFSDVVRKATQDFIGLYDNYIPSTQ